MFPSSVLTAFTLGELVTVRPSKIVAGHEADKTNEFLQLLASAVLKKVVTLIFIYLQRHRTQLNPTFDIIFFCLSNCSSYIM